MVRNINKDATHNDARYWLFLHPYVHLNVKKTSAVVYNTLNGTLLQYHEGHLFLKILRRLDKKENLYVTRLYETEMTPEVKIALMDLRRNFSGDFFLANSSQKAPIQMKPVLTLEGNQENVNRKMNLKWLQGDEISEYLSELTFYINNRCRYKCTICQKAFQQFSFCKSDKSSDKEIPLEKIREILCEAEGTMLNQINIIGGNIFFYSQFDKLIELMETKYFLKSYYLNYMNCQDVESLKIFHGRNEKNCMHIHIQLPYNSFVLEKVVHNLSEISIKKIFHFTISSVEESNIIEKTVSLYDLQEVELHPYYTGSNLDFFSSYVFTDINSIVDSKPTMADIFLNITINSNDFSRLTIMPDCSVYANVNNPRLGTISNDTLFDLIKTELSKGKSWNRIRKNITPCKSCPYHSLCPPISNYEYVIGKYDLCSI